MGVSLIFPKYQFAVIRRNMTVLALETRRSTAIANIFDESEPTPGELLAADDLKKRHPTATHRPTQVCYGYNCHGLTFASRRTQVYKTSCVTNILEEDGYDKIEKQDVLPGDVCIYRDDNGEVSHSGIVIGVNTDLLIPRIKVLSKWGAAHEVLHFEEDCPYVPADLSYYRISK